MLLVELDVLEARLRELALRAPRLLDDDHLAVHEPGAFVVPAPPAAPPVARAHRRSVVMREE